MKYCLTLAYDGTDYAGWQWQAGQPTLQAELETALARLAGQRVVTHAAGRTDAGVHALGQVVSCALAKPWEEEALRRALNGNLPAAMRVLKVSQAHDDFHARLYARAKSYRYQLWCGRVMNPLLERYAWHFPYQLDVTRLQAEAQHLIGTHDFTAFTVTACTVKSRVRTIHEVRIVTGEADNEDLLTLTFRGNGFLRYQVRAMVSALLAFNRGRLRDGSLANVLALGRQARLDPPAPAKGLTLLKVEY